MAFAHVIGSVVFTTAVATTLLAAAAAAAAAAFEAAGAAAGITAAASPGTPVVVFVAACAAAVMGAAYDEGGVRQLWHTLAPPSLESSDGAGGGAAAGAAGAGAALHGTHGDCLLPCTSWGLLWAGWALGHALLPVCLIATLLNPRVEWGGITYTRAHGRVIRVMHKS